MAVWQTVLLKGIGTQTWCIQVPTAAWPLPCSCITTSHARPRWTTQQLHAECYPTPAFCKTSVYKRLLLAFLSKTATLWPSWLLNWWSSSRAPSPSLPIGAPTQHFSKTRHVAATSLDFVCVYIYIHTLLIYIYIYIDIDFFENFTGMDVYSARPPHLPYSQVVHDKSFMIECARRVPWDQNARCSSLRL